MAAMLSDIVLRTVKIVFFQWVLSPILNNLESLKNGEGILYKTTMILNNLGKIDVCEYIYFLAQHGRRHVTQMEKNQLNYSLPIY
jgi:hypothetical protein